MYTGLLHTHRLVVSIFVALYLVKMILLLMNKEKQLDDFRKWTKVPEMIAATLFLVTGVAMLIIKPTLSFMQVIKFVAIVAAIPFGVIGFVRKNKLMGTLSFVLLVAAYGLAEMGKKIVPRVELAPDVIVDIDAEDYDELSHGKALYTEYCQSCHGADGRLMLAGASDLSITGLKSEDVFHIIQHGRGRMPAFGKVLSRNEMQAIVNYTETLRED